MYFRWCSLEWSFPTFAYRIIYSMECSFPCLLYFCFLYSDSLSLNLLLSFDCGSVCLYLRAVIFTEDLHVPCRHQGSIQDTKIEYFISPKFLRKLELGRLWWKSFPWGKAILKENIPLWAIFLWPPVFERARNSTRCSVCLAEGAVGVSKFLVCCS